MQFVTLTELKEHLRYPLDDDAPDADLTLKIQTASAIVREFLSGSSVFLPDVDSEFNTILDSNGDVVYVEVDGDKVIRQEVKNATLLLVGFMDDNRESDDKSAFSVGALPFAVTSLLYHIKKLAV